MNVTTPTGYAGGEPVKAYLLERYGIPMVDGFASVILAETTMTIAQIAYILVGIGLGLWLLLPSREFHGRSLTIVAVVTCVGLLLFATPLFILIQRRGLFTVLFTLRQKCRLRIAPLEARRRKLFTLDQTILAFYSRARGAFVFSTAAFLCGWLVETTEVYLILLYRDAPIAPLTALSIDALSTFIKGGAFFVAGSVGQEAGNLMLVMASGHSEVIGMTLAMLPRLRELVWIAIGLVCLAFLRIGQPLSGATG